MVINQVFAAGQIGLPVLSLLVALPVAVAIVVALCSSIRWAHAVATLGAVAELAIAVWLVAELVPGTTDMQFVERHGLYHLGIDGISALFLPLTALLTLLATVYAEPVRENLRGYLITMHLFAATMIGAFVAVDMLLFWAFFVAEIVPSYYLITRYGTGDERRAAARTYVGFMTVSSLALGLAIWLLGSNHLAATGHTSHDLIDLLKVPVSGGMQTAIFVLLCLALAIKAPLVPFHTWMPRVLEQGPIIGMGVFLVGVKLGTYAFLRFVVPLLPEAAHEWFWVLAGLGAISMVYGALIALVQTNLRRLLAFASVSHMGVVMLGVFSLNFSGFQGGLLQMLNLGVTGAGLFFVAGFLANRIGTPDLSSMGGLGQYVPRLALTFLIIGLAGIGMPGTSGFNGEHLVMIGAFKVHWSMALVTGAGTVLAAMYFLSYYQRAFLGDRTASKAPSLQDLNAREMVIAGSLAAVIFWIGLYTSPFLNTMNGSLQGLAAHVEIDPAKRPVSALVAPSAAAVPR